MYLSKSYWISSESNKKINGTIIFPEVKLLLMLIFTRSRQRVEASY